MKFNELERSPMSAELLMIPKLSRNQDTAAPAIATEPWTKKHALSIIQFVKSLLLQNRNSHTTAIQLSKYRLAQRDVKYS